MPLETALTHLPKYMINDKIAEKVINGAVITYSRGFQEEKDFICYGDQHAGKALAIYIHHPEKPG